MRSFWQLLVLLLSSNLIRAAFTFLPSSSRSINAVVRTNEKLDRKCVSASTEVSLIPSIVRSNRNTALASAAEQTNDDEGSEEGLNLAAEFFRAIKDRDVELDLDEYDDDDEDENEEGKETPVAKKETGSVKPTESEKNDQEEDDDDSVDEIPISKVNVFTGRDEGNVGKLAGNVTFTNRELYENLKDRVLESPSAFATLVGEGNEEDTEENDDDADDTYKPLSLVPDSGLTAGEVVMGVLDALNHNDVPTENYGVELLFAYASAKNVLKSDKSPSVEEYADFIKTSEYAPMLDHSQVIIDKGDYSFDKKKAYFNARLRTGSGRDFTAVNFILSTNGTGEDDCWLIDSAIIRTDGLGRGRRRR